jgi:hypothetical protein
VISHIKTSFLLQISGNGEGKNEKTMTSLPILNPKYSNNNPSTYLFKTTICSSSFINSTKTSWPKRKHTIFNASRKPGQ